MAENDSTSLEPTADISDLAEIEQSIRDGFLQISGAIQQLVESGLPASELTEIRSAIEQNAITISGSIERTTHSAWDEIAVSAILAAFIAALAAFLFNHLNWKIIRRIENKTQCKELLITQIETLEKTAIGYWMQPYSEGKAVELSCMEAEIKSLLASIRSNTEVLKSVQGATQEPYVLAEKLDTFNNFAFDFVTGGSFESKSRMESRFRAVRILKEFNTIKSSLRLELFK